MSVVILLVIEGIYGRVLMVDSSCCVDMGLLMLVLLLSSLFTNLAGKWQLLRMDLILSLHQDGFLGLVRSLTLLIKFRALLSLVLRGCADL